MAGRGGEEEESYSRGAHGLPRRWRRALAGSRVSLVTCHIFRKYIEHGTLARVGRQVLSGRASEGMGLGKEVVHGAKRKEKPAYKIFIIVVFIVAKPEYDPRD